MSPDDPTIRLENAQGPEALDHARRLFRFYASVSSRRPAYRAHPAKRAVFMERTLGSDGERKEVRMRNETIAEVVQTDMAAYIEHLAARVERLARSLSVGIGKVGAIPATTLLSRSMPRVFSGNPC